MATLICWSCGTEAEVEVEGSGGVWECPAFTETDEGRVYCSARNDIEGAERAVGRIVIADGAGERADTGAQAVSLSDEGTAGDA